MILVSVMYPAVSTTKFDFDYYTEKHIPLIKKKRGPFGLGPVQVIRGLGEPDGTGPDYAAMTPIQFDTMDNFKTAGKAHGRDINGDIPNFTDAKAVVQIGEIVG